MGSPNAVVGHVVRERGAHRLADAVLFHLRVSRIKGGTMSVRTQTIASCVAQRSWARSVQSHRRTAQRRRAV